MRILKKQLSTYLGISKWNIAKHYQCYLDALDIKNRNYLTVYDVATLDNLTPLQVAKLSGFAPNELKKIAETC